FSREDLLRAFDLLTRADADIRGAAQPRYHLEMALLRWIYLRKLAPIEDLIANVGAGRAAEQAPGGRPQPARPPAAASAPAAAQSPSRIEPERAPAVAAERPQASRDASLKDAFLAEIRKSKAVFYNTVVAQAQRIDVSPDRVTFTFSPTQRALRDQLEQNRGWLESVAQQAGGRAIAGSSAQTEGDAPPGGAAPRPSAAKKSALREKALADSSVQALLEVFPAEIRDVEEM